MAIQAYRQACGGYGRSLIGLRASIASKASRRAFATGRLDGPRKETVQPTKLDPRIFQVSEIVQEAVHSGKPVVALETTIYTHGFPYPDNLALASHLESVVRQNGGVPATIGVLNGVAHVGLDAEELIQLASAAEKSNTMKLSRRDLSYITGLGLAGRKLHGGTTIAATMILAKMAGIEVFGTGGLGGVHRGAQDSMDISADLTELGRTRVAVISSGCKAFLDIGRTLEYLETQGAYVGTFADGRTGNVDIPAFWSRDSGIVSPTVVQDEKEAAAIIYAQKLLGIESGLFFANPIPEEHSIPSSELNAAIEEAVREAADKGYYGHRNTPFILNKIKELTGGQSVVANRALITSNVARATRVAVELSKLRLPGSSGDQPTTFMPEAAFRAPLETAGNSQITTLESIQPSDVKINVLVAGSIAVDLSCDYTPFTTTDDPSPTLYTSNPASIQQSIGGVGHNVAYAAHLVSGDASVRLCSYVAKDLAGSLILATLKDRGVDTSDIVTPKSISTDGKSLRTAQYIAVNDFKKDLMLAMADMDIIGSANTDSTVLISALDVCRPKWAVVDANWHFSFLQRFISQARKINAKTAFEPVSVAKSTKLFPSLSSILNFDASLVPAGTRSLPLPQIDLAAPNEHELKAMHTAAKEQGYFELEHWWKVIDALGIPSTGARVQFSMMTSAKLVDQGIPQMAVQLLPFISTVVTKLGPEGVLVTRLLAPDDPLLAAPDAAPYILSRNSDGSELVGGVYMRLYPAAEKVPAEAVVSVNGVGDTFLGVLIAGLARDLQLEEKLVGLAQRAAVMTLKSSEAVSPDVAALAQELRA